MAHAQKPDFVFRRNGRVHLNRQGRRFSRLLCSRGVRISGSNAGYTKFRGSMKGTGYPLHSTVSSSLLLPCVTVCHHISTGLYLQTDTVRATKLWGLWFSLSLFVERLSQNCGIQFITRDRCSGGEHIDCLALHTASYRTVHTGSGNNHLDKLDSTWRQMLTPFASFFLRGFQSVLGVTEVKKKYIFDDAELARITRIVIMSLSKTAATGCAFCAIHLPWLGS